MIPRLDNPAALALDAKSLGQLRAQAKQSPDQALKAAAKQFESVFLNMMLKSMRDASPQDGMFDNEQSKMFTGMLDQQLAQNMANRGLGLADMLVKQLTPGGGGQVGSGKGGELSEGAGSGKLTPQSSSLLNPLILNPPLLAPLSSVGAVPSAYNQSAQQDFVDRMLPHAMQASKASGVPAPLMLGQAALESGWGRREILNADGSNSHNLFGIKANAGWNGKVAEVTTTEYKHGVAHKEVAKFRAYASYDEAFKDYAKLLSANPRYADVMKQGSDTAGMAQALQKAGYATDPKYADKLTRVMGSMNLVG